MSKQTYSLDTLALLMAEIDKVKEARKKILLLDNLLLRPKKEVAELIKSGCNARDVTAIFKAAHIKVGVAKIKQLYFLKKNDKKVVQKGKLPSQ